MIILFFHAKMDGIFLELNNIAIKQQANISAILCLSVHRILALSPLRRWRRPVLNRNMDEWKRHMCVGCTCRLKKGGLFHAGSVQLDMSNCVVDYIPLLEGNNV